MKTIASENVPLERLRIHPAANRENTDPEDLSALAETMRNDGQLQACVARPLSDGRYELIFGSRRFKAAKLAGLKTLRVDVREIGDREALETIGIENMMRKDFNPIERADYIMLLTTLVSKGGAGMTVGEVARRFSKSDSWVRNVRRLTHLPEFWRKMVATGTMPERNARMFVPHAGKAPVMKALEASFKRNPDAWRSESDCAEQLRFIVDRFEAKPRAMRPMPLDRMSRMDLPKAHVEERIDRQADELIEATDLIELDWDSSELANRRPHRMMRRIFTTIDYVSSRRVPVTLDRVRRDVCERLGEEFCERTIYRDLEFLSDIGLLDRSAAVRRDDKPATWRWAKIPPMAANFKTLFSMSPEAGS